MRTLYLLTILFLLAPRGFAVTTVSINPSADAFVTSSYSMVSFTGASSNYGKAGALAISAPGQAKGTLQSTLRFDMSTVKAAFDSQFGTGQWVVSLVKLQLTATSGPNAIFNSNATGQFSIDWMANDSWAEGTGTPMTATTDGITYNSLLSTYINNTNDQNLGSAFDYTAASSGNLEYTLGLMSGLTGDILAGSLASLRLYAGSGTMSGMFNSRDFGNASNSASWPLLTINAVAAPEPGRALLCLMGLGMVCLRRKRLALA